MVAQLMPLQDWCKLNGLAYAHALVLIKQGLFPPAVRVGRRLFVSLALAEAWIQAGGSSFAGGWRKKAEPRAAAGR
jgi:hypothetical protein